MTPFRWIDRHGVAHDLSDGDTIEREHVAIATELDLLVPRLVADVPIQDTIVALECARTLVRRISVLERTMNHWTTQIIAAVRDDYRMFLDDLEK